MKREIKLNDQYILMLKILYVKNCSTGEKQYEITSKIVNVEDYKIGDYTGEIQGEYFKRIRVFSPVIFKTWGEYLTERRIKKTIIKFTERSKRLVAEWDNRDKVMTNIHLFLDRIG